MRPAVGEIVASASVFQPSHSRPFFLFSTPMYPLWGHTSLTPTHHTVQTENCLSPVNAVACWGVFRERGWVAGEGGGSHHHCVAGFITWSLTGLFLPHLCPTFWLPFTYDSLMHSGYKGSVIQEKELDSKPETGNHFPVMDGAISGLSFIP